MFQLLLLAAATAALSLVDYHKLNIENALPLSSRQVDVLAACFKWGLPLWLLHEVNSTLNRWADNRWCWKNDTSSWHWDSEIAVVTGGSAGIGAHVVKHLVCHGIRVAVLDVSPLSDLFTPVEKTVIGYYKCDITSHDEVHNVAQAIRSDFGSPSILVNNAGIGNAHSILSIPMKSLKKLFDVNLLSQWSTVQEFLPDMLANKKGHIMSVASLASFVTVAGAADYSCTKAALLTFHEALTQELKHRYNCPQIKTSIVHPNWTKSALTAHPAIQAGLKRMGAKLLEPDDVAQAMVKQIIGARSGQLVLGPALAPKVRALPMWIQEIVRDGQSKMVTGQGTTGKLSVQQRRAKSSTMRTNGDLYSS